jgi:hypothetical protein
MGCVGYVGRREVGVLRKTYFLLLFFFLLFITPFHFIPWRTERTAFPMVFPVAHVRGMYISWPISFPFFLLLSEMDGWMDGRGGGVDNEYDMTV